MTEIHNAGAKPKGWFSRRHETREAHDKARAAYLMQRGPEARRVRASDYDDVAARYSCGHIHGSRRFEKCGAAA